VITARPGGTLVVGVVPDAVEGHVLERARGDAALWDVGGVVALVVVEAPSFGGLRSSAHDGARRDLGAVRAAIAAGVEASSARAGAAAVPLALRVVRGAPVKRLTDVSAGTVGLYVGRGSVDGPGAVALGCAFSARCPVTLVPREEAGSGRGPLVVGLDDSQCARAAVEHAFEEGVRGGRPVVVVSVLDELADATGPGPPPDGGDDVRRAVEVRSRSAVHELVAHRTVGRRPEVRVEVLEGSPAVVLCDVARRLGASVLVLGARGRGRAGGPGTPLGVVATRVLLRATGSVRIVRDTHR
jgi:nucleotide-binding universal stress UspA family protein